MKKRTLSLLGITLSLLGIILMVGSVLGLAACLGPTGIDPDAGLKFPGKIETVDVTAAVLMLANRSRTVDVTNVTITQPEEIKSPPWAVSFANKPKRLEKKAQYLTPSDESYQVTIDYSFDEITVPDGAGTKTLPAGTGTKTVLIPLPLPRQIVEYVIYRNDKGVVIIDKEALDPDPTDTGNPAIDPLPGEGSTPAVIPPDARNKMATFVVVSKTNSQNIDSVNFIMGDNSYTMHGIHARDKQSIALGQGSWETRLTYIRDGNTKSLGPVNSIIVPSNDPQSVQEHYLYFYLNKRGDYAISQEWPPFPNDVEEEDLLPPDNGYGRSLIKIINNSYAMAEMVIIHNLRDVSRFPFAIDYDSFTPPIPIQYNKTGYVDVVGTERFPIEAHDGYLIQVRLESSESSGIVERKAYIKDQTIEIVIEAEDLHFNNTQGAKVTLENSTTEWPVEIINLTVQNKLVDYQNSYFNANSWVPQGAVISGKNVVQYVMSTTSMPISPGAQFDALVAIQGNGITRIIPKKFSPAELYSELPPDQNTRTITIRDTDIPNDIKDAFRGAKVTLENKVSSWPVEIIGLSVWNKSRPLESTYYDSNTWEPNVSIGKGGSAVQMVFNSAVMPIIPGNKFGAMVIIYGSGVTETITKDFTPPELYSDKVAERNTRTITIDDSDVPDSIKNAFIYTKGARVTIKNNVASWPIQITSMTVRNRVDYGKNSYYDPSTWEPKNLIDNYNSAVQTVMSSPAMPITQSAEFEALLTLFGNGRRATVTMPFIPAELYSGFAPAQNTRIIVIEDGDIPLELRTPTVPPPDPLKGATVTIENKISSWPVQITGMTVRNVANNNERTYYDGANWMPIGPIDKNGSATQKVLSSTAMPINTGIRFEAVITMYGSFTYGTRIIPFSPAELYSIFPPEQNFRTITITDSEVPDNIKDAYTYSRGAKVTLENNVSAKWPIQITGMTIRNKVTTSQKTDYTSTAWEPNGLIANSTKAVQMVRSTAAMPIKPGVEFEALITLFGNGQYKTVSKTFNPAVLYSTADPEQNTRTITIIDSDIPTELQTPPTYETEIPGLDGSTDIGDTVMIDTFPWYVADKEIIGDKTYVMLVCKVAMAQGVVFHEPRNSDYNGSKLQAKMAELYNKMVQMKKIAVIPNLGNHSQGYATQLTTTMAGTRTNDIFFALTYRDVLGLNDQAHRYGSTFWWTRSPVTRETVFEVNPHGVIGPAVSTATGLGAVPGVWVRTK